MKTFVASAGKCRKGRTRKGNAQDLDLFGTDVSPRGGVCGQQEGSNGGGTYDSGEHGPSSPGGILALVHRTHKTR